MLVNHQVEVDYIVIRDEIKYKGGKYLKLRQRELCNA